MSDYKYYVIHCMASPARVKFSKSQIIQIFKNKGWRKVGYSTVINQDGTVHDFVEHNGDEFIQNDEITNGVRGWNSVSKHISYAGGVNSNRKPKDTRTLSQYLKMAELVFEEIEKHPNIKVCGHNQFPRVSKACPSFSVTNFLDELSSKDKLKKRLRKLKAEDWFIDSYIISVSGKIKEKNIVRGKIA